MGRYRSVPANVRAWRLRGPDGPRVAISPAAESFGPFAVPRCDLKPASQLPHFGAR
jgi:hypothetical protein